MKSITMITALILMGFSNISSAGDTPLQSMMPPGMKSGHDTVQAAVLKVFAVNDDGARFRAYLVEWKGSEVIVSDPLGTSDKKEGEQITFIAQRIEMPHANKDINVLHFMIMDVLDSYSKRNKREIPKKGRSGYSTQSVHLLEFRSHDEP